MLNGMVAKLRLSGWKPSFSWRRPRREAASAAPSPGPQRTQAIEREGRIKRIRIIVWALLIAGLCGAIDFGRPLEDVIQAGRDKIRSRPAPQDIVVVAIDDRTIAALGGLGFSRRHYAKAIDNAFAMGAKRVYFDMAFADPTNEADDAALAETMARYRGRVFIGAMRQGSGKHAGEIVPQPRFAAAASIVSLNASKTPFKLNMRISRGREIGGQLRPSMAASLADAKPVDELFKPDWSMRFSTVPTVSLVDLLRNEAGSRLTGRDLIVAHTSWSGRDFHPIVSQGWWPGVYFHVVAAQTLKQGNPVLLGWLPAFLIALIACCGLSLSRRVKPQHVIAATTAGLMLVAPVIADAWLVTLDVVPALLLLSIAYYRLLVLRRLELSQAVNRSSGLANLNLLRDKSAYSDQIMVALKLRNFADIDASFGHSVEAPLTAEICRRMAAAGIAGEIYHGEDSLVWFMPSLPLKALGDHLEGLRTLLLAPVLIGSRRLDLLVSFGTDSDFEEPVSSRVGSAIKCAAEAAEDGELWKHYEPVRRDNADWELSLLGLMEEGIDNGQVWVAFQPQYDFHQARIIGAEALVRWDHPERGAINPEEFVIAAERHNRIDKLTWFVLDRAIAVAAEINRGGTDFSISVNLSALILRSSLLEAKIRNALRRHKLSPRKLVLEITETGRISHIESAVDRLHALARTGIRLSIDDYGTGFATLDYFRIIPATEIKIDRRFISNLNPGKSEMVLVASTIAMAHSMGCQVVAEGVEQERELEILRASGCDLAQGFLVGKPSPPDLLKALIASPELRRTG